MENGDRAEMIRVTVLDRRISRRALLRGIGIGGASLAATAFVACGDDDSDDTSGGTTTEGDTGTTSEDGAPGEVDQTSFIFQFPAPHAGLLVVHYAAQEMGFWEEEGLEVSIEYATAGTPLIAGGTVDYGEILADGLLNAKASGQDLTVFYQPVYGQVFGFVVPVDSEITEWTAEQITGKVIGVTELIGGEVPALRAALFRIGLSEGEEVELFPTSASSQAITADAFNTGRIDIFAGSLLDHAAVQVAGIELRAITPDFVLDAAGDNAIATRSDHLAENRDQAVRFGRGMAKAKVWVLANFDDAIDSALEVAPETGTREEVASFVELLLVNRSLPPEKADIEEGQIWIEGWEAFQALLLEGGTGSPDDPLQYTEPIDVSGLVDNTLAPEIFDFDRAEIEARTR